MSDEAQTQVTQQVHERDLVAEAAARELVPFLNEWVQRHGLTACEYLYLLGVASHRQVQAMCVHERSVKEPT